MGIPRNLMQSYFISLKMKRKNTFKIKTIDLLSMSVLC